jgi:hypothetical protein
MPYVRGGVLEVAGRTHVVAVTDLSPEGAFLQTKVAVEPGQAIKLRMVLPRDGHEVTLPCLVARRSERSDPGSGQPAGLAVRFKGLTAAAVRRVEEFAQEGFLPAVEPTPHEHVEYRVLERAEIAEAELNQLGLDGWELTAVLPAKAGIRLVLLRRL